MMLPNTYKIYKVQNYIGFLRQQTNVNKFPRYITSNEIHFICGENAASTDKNQSACMNAEIERGKGGERVFSPNKDLGTRVGD